MAYNRLSKYETSINRVGDDVSVIYHSTRIVLSKSIEGRRVVTLDTGGWKGVTTKRKMNQASHQFGLNYSVYQSKGEWYVTTKAGTFDYEGRTFIFDAETGLPLDELAIFAPKTVDRVKENSLS